MTAPWTVFESSELLSFYRSTAPLWADENWIDIDQFVERLLGPAPHAAADPAEVPELWKSALADLRWAGMLDSSHVEFAEQAIDDRVRLGAFFKWARREAEHLDQSDRAFRLWLLTDALRKTENPLELPALRWVQCSPARSLFTDLGDVLSHTETEISRLTPADLHPASATRATPRFLFSGPALARLRDVSERWLKDPKHRLAVLIEGPALMETRVRLALAKYLAPPPTPAPAQVDRWITRARAEPSWPASRRYEIASRLHASRAELETSVLPVPEGGEPWTKLGITPEEIQLLTADTPSDERPAPLPRAVIRRKLSPIALPRETLVVLVCGEGLDPSASLFTDRDRGALMQAGFELPVAARTTQQLALELEHAEAACAGRAITFCDRRFDARPVQRDPIPVADNVHAPAVRVPARRMLSASQCEAYVACPARYFYRYVLGLTYEPKPFVRLPLLFGQLVHGVLERHFRESPTATWDTQHIDGLAAPLLQTLGGTPAENHLLTLQLRHALTQVPKLEEELTSLFPTPGKPQWFELAFEFEFEKMLLCGRIDRVDQLADGSVLLIDYKTGAAVFSPEHILKGHHFQAVVYLLAAEKKLGQPAAGMIFYDLREGEIRRGVVHSEALAERAAKKLTRGHAMTAERFEQVLAQGVDELRRVVGAIAGGNFPPSPSAQNCAQCDYAAHCRHAFHWEPECRS